MTSTSVTDTYTTESAYSLGTARPSGVAEQEEQSLLGKTSQTAGSQTDEVKISAAAQAKALKSQGQTVKQIAESLGCSIDEVKTYLGITDDDTTSSSSTGTTQYSSSQVSQLLEML